MFKNYLKIAWRNLIKNKVYSVINIVGLAVGMAVAILIGMWMKDELSFNKSFDHYDKIVRVIQNSSDGQHIATYPTVSIPLALELRDKYAADFTQLALTKSAGAHVLALEDKKISRYGEYVELEFTDMFSLVMVKGSRQGLGDPSSIMINQSLSNALFGDADPINSILKIDNKNNLKVIGVFEDFGSNTDFKGIDYLLPWSSLLVEQPWVKEGYKQWNNNSFSLYGQLSDRADINGVSAKVKGLLIGKPDREDKPEVILQPMSAWHLYSEYKEGINTGGAIKYVWMFGFTGLFVLLLACINFMNLSTARSQHRAKEVGIRKTIGSARKSLIIQFLSESMLVSSLALILSILLVLLSLPWFNLLADKEMGFPWFNLFFWMSLLGFMVFAGLLSGSYPALYLSSFKPVSVLKGTFKAGRFAALPRKILVVFQFSVSVSLIIGAIIVFQQIKYAKNRPLGFERDGLINVFMTTPDLYGKYESLRNELINSMAVTDMAEASSAMTYVSSHLIGFDWKGKDPGINISFGVTWVTHDFGNTVGWQFLQGRDFSRDFSTDSSGIVLNEAAVRHIGIENPLNETINFDGEDFHVIGVVKDVVMESPFAQVAPAVFFLDYDNVSAITIKVNPAISMSEALPKIETVFQKYSPAMPFDYSFVDQDFAQKFAAEQRVSSLVTFFTIFAVFISCLGIFGLASFMAEQRTKEIGVRKVLGATIANLWRLLSQDFLLLVSISFLIAIPASWYFMHNWLESYDYHTDISLWIFVVTAIVVIVITLVTVSFQAIKAALANPVKSLRME